MNVLLRVHTIIDVVSGIDAEQVALMPMMGVFILPIVEPLLQVSLLANLVRVQT